MRGTLDAARSLKRYMALGLGDEWEVRLNSEEGAFKRPFCRIDLVGGTSLAPAGEATTDVQMAAAMVLYPQESSTATQALFRAMDVEETLYVIFNRGATTLSAPGTITATKQATGSLEGDYRYVVCAKNRYGKTTASQPVTVEGVSGRVKLSWRTFPEATSYQVFRGTPQTAAGKERFLLETDDEQTEDGIVFDDGSATPVPNTRPPYANTARLGAPMRVPLYDYDGVSISRGASDRLRPRGDFMRITEPPSVSRLSDDKDDLMWVVTANIRLSWRRSNVVTSALPIIRSVNISEDVA